MEAFELELVKPMTAEQRMYFQTEYNSVKKDPTTGLLLCLFLGGLGAHHFYLGKVGLGILYAVFVWTFIPAVVAFVECFLMKGRILRYNEAKGREIAMQVNVLHANTAAALSPALT